ncbi:hypothetical protein RHGRI_029998 [Rhododendron griersonianum]|uniref:Oxidation resistance protein 1 n=1 Tax=Rhododendron griersonianum TaxID=479676 RepID=A0AAV6IPT2_9ERIC|nr:hypothetical protein RHGRI_029998 [Rhododendron griersonianum]
MGRKQSQGGSLRSKAAHFVSDVTTVFLNPISDKPSKEDKHPQSDDETEPETNQLGSITEEGSSDSVDEPDTSSFTAFLYSLLSSSKSETNSNPDGQKENQEGSVKPASDSIVIKESSGKRSLFSKGKQSIGRALYQAARLGGYRNQASGNKGNSDLTISGGNNSTVVEDVDIPLQMMSESVDLDNLPEISEPSLLLTEKTRSTLYHALPVLVQGRNWVLLYRFRLVVGDRKGAVFGGLVEAPLRATNKRKYQGTNDSFVFTNTPGHPVIFRPTGRNRYFTLCSTEFLALGGGSHFALYLDGDLLNGSSSASDTYGNSCLACSEDFEVKEIELWGFVYASKYEEMVSLLRTETPGIARW